MFADEAGIQFTGNNNSSNAEAAANIVSWFTNNLLPAQSTNHQFMIFSSNNNQANYEIDVACTVTNHGASNVQQELVVTIKYTGDGLVEQAEVICFSKAGIRVGNYNSTAFI